MLWLNLFANGNFSEGGPVGSFSPALSPESGAASVSINLSSSINLQSNREAAKKVGGPRRLYPPPLELRGNSHLFSGQHKWPETNNDKKEILIYLKQIISWSNSYIFIFSMIFISPIVLYDLGIYSSFAFEKKVIFLSSHRFTSFTSPHQLSFAYVTSRLIHYVYCYISSK